MASAAAQERKRRWATSESGRAYHREWIRAKRASDPAYAKRESEKTRKWQKANPINFAFRQYQSSAKRRGLDFSLNIDELSRLITLECSYCGAMPSPVHGIDRVDNRRGYVHDNVVTACRQCNVAKGTLSVDSFLDWVCRVSAGVSARRIA